MKKEVALSPCELITMQCAWKIDGFFTVEDMVNAISEFYHKDWTEINCKAFLNRLIKKGMVGRKRKGFKRYYYCKRMEDEVTITEQRGWIRGWY